jgi:hypothetical protein
MKRAFLPSTVDRDGIPMPSCTGSCNQGRAPCDCAAFPRQVLHPHLHRVTLTELDLELPFDAERTFSGKTSEQLRAERERNVTRVITGAQAFGWTVALAALCAALMAGMKG